MEKIVFVFNSIKSLQSITLKYSWLNGYVYDFFVEHKIINNKNVIKIHKYSMEKDNMKLISLLNLSSNEYNQRLHCYSFIINLDTCNGSCNTLNYPSNKVCVPNITEDLSVHVLIWLIWINQSQILTKDISCEWKHIFNGRKGHSNQKWNNDKCLYERKNQK